ncbi:MAG: hypothetical protein ACT6RD_02060 [Brevundimonas sp.]|uniref:hypothetical protein n=1 Tax=Brevundimonas sp. TaxID=1871086 RepID=UPI0040342FDC
MTLKSASRPETTTRFTRLETAVMAALAQDLRGRVPDLARQFATARPERRRNTAFGAYTGMTGDRPRSGAEVGLTGRFGTVHAMIPGLSEAVAFQVELLNGRLFALHADSYGQDTRGIDFAAAHPTEIFTLDEAGRSIPWSPTPNASETSPRPTVRPAVATPRTTPPTVFVQPPTKASSAPSRTAAAPQRTQDNRPPTSSASMANVVFGKPTVSNFEDIPAPEDQKSLLLGLWVAIGAVAILATMLFDVPFPIALFLAFFAGRAVRNPKVLAVIAALLKQAQEQQALNATKR